MKPRPITITVFDVIHLSVFYLKHDVSEVGFCLRFQVEPTQMGLKEILCLCLMTLAVSVGPI
jgi:hypothetical protein